MLRRFLLIIAMPIMITHAAYQSTGCAEWLRNVDELSDPSDDKKLSDCRKLARDAKADGSTGEDAYRAYYECTKDGGLR
jgi:hypothetical protein